jgi:hypothetical protein
MADDDDHDESDDWIYSFADFGLPFGLNAEDMMTLANARHLPFTRENDGEHYVRSEDLADWTAAAWAEQEKRKDAQGEKEN